MFAVLVTDVFPASITSRYWPTANTEFTVATIRVGVLLRIFSLWLFSVTESTPVKPAPPIVT